MNPMGRAPLTVIVAAAVLVALSVSGAGAGSHSRVAPHDRVHPPNIDEDHIPYGSERRSQMAGYSKRHYGHREWRLLQHRAIVLHFTDTATYGPVWNTFASNDPNMGERPGVCAQYVVGKEGGVHELVRPNIRCRQTIGLNQLSVGIEMVQEEGRSSHWADREILERRRQSGPAVRLVAWLKQRYGIEMRHVIGHSMANQSPLFEDKEGWRNDHTDWLRRDVVTFRHRVARLLHGH
jgi:hypothetical protein